MTVPLSSQDPVQEERKEICYTYEVRTKEVTRKTKINLGSAKESQDVRRKERMKQKGKKENGNAKKKERRKRSRTDCSSRKKG